MVYTSSVATVGIPADGSPGSEEAPVALADMIGHYKRSKFLAEQVARDAARASGSVVIVNPSTPVGPGDVNQRRRAGWCWTPPPPGCLHISTPDSISCTSTTSRRVICLRYIAGGTASATFSAGDMTLHEILVEIARIAGRSPPRIRSPNAALLPIAWPRPWGV